MTPLKKILSLSLLLILAACDPPKTNRLPETPLGLQAIMRLGGQDFFLEVTDVEDNLASIEFLWHGELYAAHRYYRGLFPVSGTAEGEQYEIDLDTKILDELFPLAPGKQVNFAGTFTNVDSGALADVLVHMSVLKETHMKVGEKEFQIFVIEIQSQYRFGDQISSKTNLVYYAPEIGFILKSVRVENGRKFYWQIMSVELPDTQDTSVRRRRNNRGTVMI